MVQKVLAIAALAYLFFRSFQALKDFRSGRVLARPWLFTNRSKLLQANTWQVRIIDKSIYSRSFWLWTIGQAAGLAFVMTILVTLLVLS